jgi:hypothetical protein
MLEETFLEYTYSGSVVGIRPDLQQLDAPLGLVQESGQAFPDGVVQATVLFEHRCPVAPRDLVNMHRNLYHGTIQCAENLEEFVDVAARDAVRTQISPWLFIWQGHRIDLFKLTD